MKKTTLISSLLVAASLAFLTGCTVYEQAPPPQPQPVVEETPPPPLVEVVPVAPGPPNVWYYVPEEPMSGAGIGFGPEAAGPHGRILAQCGSLVVGAITAIIVNGSKGIGANRQI